MKPPYVVKPVNEGSSFGVVIVKEDQSHPPQIIASSDWTYGDKVMVERYVAWPRADLRRDGRRGARRHRDHPDRATPSTTTIRNTSPGGSKHVCPAKISPNIYQKIQTLALKAHQAIGCRGVSRSDFRYDDRHSENGELIWLEVNTQPGMTPTSLVPEIAAHAGHSFGELVELDGGGRFVSALRSGQKRAGGARPMRPLAGSPVSGGFVLPRRLRRPVRLLARLGDGEFAPPRYAGVDRDCRPCSCVSSALRRLSRRPDPGRRRRRSPRGSVSPSIEVRDRRPPARPPRSTSWSSSTSTAGPR